MVALKRRRRREKSCLTVERSKPAAFGLECDALGGCRSTMLHRMIRHLSRHPGACAIAVLAVLTPLSITLGIAYARDRVQCHAIAIGLVALVFWAWAMYKVALTGDSDFGAMSFALVLLGTLPALREPDSAAREGKAIRARTACCRLTGACVVVSVNYAAVLLLTPGCCERTFAIYLCVMRGDERRVLLCTAASAPDGRAIESRGRSLLGTLWWAGAAMWTATALFSYVKCLNNSGGVDFEAEALMEASEQVEGSMTGRMRLLIAQ
jgi:hypothetical protein